MLWNEVSKKTIGIIVTLVVLFAGTIIVLAVGFVRDRGGMKVMEIVTDAVKSQRIAVNGDGRRVVADRMLVTFRSNVDEAGRLQAAVKAGVHIEGMVTDQADTYIVSFPASNGLQLKDLMARLQKSVDIVAVSVIQVE